MYPHPAQQQQKVLYIEVSNYLLIARSSNFLILCKFEAAFLAFLKTYVS
jgi:hypothetical protein